MSWLKRCAGFHELINSADGEGMQEVHLYSSLRAHPYRTRDASTASLFYIPLWEYASFRLGTCNGTSHADRMASAHAALQRSPYFRRSAGADHFWASSMAIEVTYAPVKPAARWLKYRIAEYVDKRGAPPEGMHLVTASLQQRISPLGKLLAQTSVGRMKAFGRTPHGSGREPGSIGRCTFDMGHQPNQVALRLFKPAAPRPTLLYFAGGLDVCCTGKKVRCEVGQLLLESAADVHVDIGVRGDVLRSLSTTLNLPTQPCTMKALTLLARKREQPLSELVRALKAAGGQDDANSSKYETMGKMMASSVFCLCPAGDLCTTSRFVTAIAAGCIPVVLCDGLHGPFGAREGSHLSPVPYSSFWVKYSTASFIRRPAGVLELLRAMSPAEVSRHQAALRAHRHQILLQLPGSQAGTRFLEEVADCVELNVGANGNATRPHSDARASRLPKAEAPTLLRAPV